MMTFVLAAMLR